MLAARLPRMTADQERQGDQIAAELDSEADAVVATCLDNPARYPGFMGLIVERDWMARVHRSNVRPEYLMHGSLKFLAFRAFGAGVLRNAGTGEGGVRYWAVVARNVG